MSGRLFGGFTPSPNFGTHPMETATIDKILAQTGIDLSGVLGVPQNLSYEQLRDEELEPNDDDFDFE